MGILPDEGRLDKFFRQTKLTVGFGHEFGELGKVFFFAFWKTLMVLLECPKRYTILLVTGKLNLVRYI